MGRSGTGNTTSTKARLGSSTRAPSTVCNEGEGYRVNILNAVQNIRDSIQVNVWATGLLAEGILGLYI